MIIARLKELRIDKGLTQQEVGDILGFSNQRYNYYETGKREPDNETLKKLAEVFNVTTDYLLGITDNPMPPNAKKEEDKPIPQGYMVYTVNPKDGPQETRMIPLKNWEEALRIADMLDEDGRYQDN